MSIELDTTTQASRIYLRGNTFPIKDQIKSLGGHWDPDEKAWWVGKAKAADAQKLAELPEPAAAVPGKCSKCGKACKAPYTLCLNCKPAPSKCKECGAKPGPRGWPRIYRSGVCSDCYRDEREEREMGY